MKSKQKNALIGALLAVVVAMAVGYAAFAQQLNIGGTAEISSSWDVHFDPTYTQATFASTGTTVTGTPGLDGATAPTGTVTYDSNYKVATIAAKLVQPGDVVTYTLHPANYSQGLKAKAIEASPIFKLASTDNVAANWTLDNTSATRTATKGNIRFTLTSTNNTLAASTDGSTIATGGYDVVTVTAEYINVTTEGGQADATVKSAAIDVQIDYQQAA